MRDGRSSDALGAEIDQAVRDACDGREQHVAWVRKVCETKHDGSDRESGPRAEPLSDEVLQQTAEQELFGYASDEVDDQRAADQMCRVQLRTPPNEASRETNG